MTSDEERECSSCTSTIPKSGYSNTQWSKSSSISKCKYCVAAGGPPAITTSEEGATGEDILDYDDEDDGTSYIGTVLNTNADIDAPPPPKHDEDDLDNNNTTPSSPTKKTDVFYATSSGLSNWNARIAALSQSKLSSKDHDKLDGVHLSKVVDQSERSTDTATNNNAVEEKLENELEKKQLTPQEQLAKVKQPSSDDDEQQLEESDDGSSMKEGLDIKQSFITSQKNKNKSGRLSHVSLVSVDMPEEEEHQNIHTKDNKEDQVEDQGIGQGVGVGGSQQEDYQQQVVVMTEDELLEAQFSGGGGLTGEGISTITYYGRQPSITDRTKRIVRQSSEKFGSGMKRLFRRPVPTSSSAAATGVLQDNSNSSSSYSSKGAYDNMEGNNKKQQDVVRTEVTDESDDDEEEEEGTTTTTITNILQLLLVVYSRIHIPSYTSTPLFRLHSSMQSSYSYFNPWYMPYY